MAWLQQILCIISLSLFCDGLPLFLRGRPKGGMLAAPMIPKHNDITQLPPDQWFTQSLDHFNPADTRTWQQRFFVNDKHYKPGGPVFLMIGGEGTARAEWMIYGQWVQNYAPAYNALCLMLEHRFYGKSHPTKDLSTDNLQFLTSEQALADLAAFRINMTESRKLEGAKWIAFGGSYPGSLATWFRLKYPHLVSGSVASSAPLFAQLNFKEYLGVVRDALSTTGPGCNKAIHHATQQIEQLIQTEEGRKQLKQQFRLCDDIDPNNLNDVANLYSNLAGNFENVVQYNKDNRAFEGAVGTNITVGVLCGIMTSNTDSELENYAKVNTLILDTYGSKCQDFSYKKMIQELQSISWESSAGEGGRQWIYQTCTEFGYYQSSDLLNQPFGQHFPLNFSVQQCADIYGQKFTQDFILHGIRWTNTNYGGFNINVTKVVFPNGSIDPWHALGITKDLNEESPAIYIKGTAHCANMYPSTKSDPVQLVKARTEIHKLIGLWLQS